MIIFLVSGFWHGANWTFLAWGFVNACYFLPLLLLQRNRKHTNIVAENRWFPSIKEAFQLLSTFLITTLAWVFFRAQNISSAFHYLETIFSASLFQKPEVMPKDLIGLIVLLVIAEWIQRKHKHALTFSEKSNTILRWSVYVVVVLLIYFMGNYSSNFEFIYFQF